MSLGMIPNIPAKTKYFGPLKSFPQLLFTVFITEEAIKPPKNIPSKTWNEGRFFRKTAPEADKAQITSATCPIIVALIEGTVFRVSMYSKLNDFVMPKSPMVAHQPHKALIKNIV